MGNNYNSDELYHYGVKGQKRGVRRYQNPDGSLTAMGRAHYGLGVASSTAKAGFHKAAAGVNRVNQKFYANSKSKFGKTMYNANKAAEYGANRMADKHMKDAANYKAALKSSKPHTPKIKNLSPKQKKAVVAGAAVAATALATYGAYKLKKSGGLSGNGLRLGGSGNLKRIGTAANQISGSAPKGLPMKKGNLAVKNALATVDGLREVKRDRRALEAAGLAAAGAGTAALTYAKAKNAKRGIDTVRNVGSKKRHR